MNIPVLAHVRIRRTMPALLALLPASHDRNLGSHPRLARSLGATRQSQRCARISRATESGGGGRLIAFRRLVRCRPPTHGGAPKSMARAFFRRMDQTVHRAME